MAHRPFCFLLYFYKASLTFRGKIKYVMMIVILSCLINNMHKSLKKMKIEYTIFKNTQTPSGYSGVLFSKVFFNMLLLHLNIDVPVATSISFLLFTLLSLTSLLSLLSSLIIGLLSFVIVRFRSLFYIWVVAMVIVTGVWVVGSWHWCCWVWF